MGGVGIAPTHSNQKMSVFTRNRPLPNLANICKLPYFESSTQNFNVIFEFARVELVGVEPFFGVRTHRNGQIWAVFGFEGGWGV